MGQRVFEIGDLVVGYCFNGIHKDDDKYNGQIGVVVGGSPSCYRITYPDGTYWFYNARELEHAKNKIVTDILNDL